MTREDHARVSERWEFRSEEGREHGDIVKSRGRSALWRRVGAGTGRGGRCVNEQKHLLSHYRQIAISTRAKLTGGLMGRGMIEMVDMEIALPGRE